MIYLMLADGFEITEALTTVDVLRRAKLDVKTVGVYSETVTSSCNIKVTADITPNEVELNNMDCVILPGGLDGTHNLDASDFVHSVLDYAIAHDKYICAICAAPSILGKRGILDGKNATCYPGFEINPEKVNYTGEAAVCTDKVITGKGAGCTIQFGLLIAEKLSSKEMAQKVSEAMQCP